MTPISERKIAPYHIYKKQKKLRHVYMYKKKARHFSKSTTICVPFLLTKSQTLYVTRFFMNFLKLAFMHIQKAWYFALHDVIYTKSLKLRKKQDNLRHVFLYTESLTLCITRFFIEFLKFAEGGRHFYIGKTMHLELNLCMKRTVHFTLRFFIRKARHFASICFYPKNNALCVMFLYLKFILHYILMPTVKGWNG